MRLCDERVERIIGLPSPSSYAGKFPVDTRLKNKILGWRQQIWNIISGEDQRMLIIVGPCSIYDEKATLEYARFLAEQSEKFKRRIMIVMRAYFEKPRTTIGWPGFLYDPKLNGSCQGEKGLSRARYILFRIAQLGVPAATEWVDPIAPQYLADLTSWGAIGARSVESQTHRQLASGLSMPIGFKNGTGGTPYSIQIAVNAMIAASNPHAFLGTNMRGRVAMVYTKGNPKVHLVLRGGEEGPNYGPESVAAACAMLKKANFLQGLLVDCSHGNSGKDHTRQPLVFRDVLRQHRGGNSSIAGVMVESFIEEGSQEINGERYGVSKTDACIGQEETAELLREAYEAFDTKVVSV